MTADEAPAPLSHPTLLQLASVFLLIGATAFGGQVALLALLNRELVERRHWMTTADITEAFTYTKLLPGPVVVQVVAYLGYRLRGVIGLVTASVLFLLPSVGAMLLLAMTYQRIATNAGVHAALGGLMAAVVGIITVATFGQARKGVMDAMTAVVATVVCVAAIVWEVNPALLVLGAGILGIIRVALKPKAETETTAS